MATNEKESGQMSVKVPEYLKDTKSVPGSRGTARTRVIGKVGDPHRVVLYVRFGAYDYQHKWRDVGYYPTIAAAHRAVEERTYGF